jgi:hypothetical protein
MARNEQGIETVRLEPDSTGATLTVRDGAGEHQVACGYGEWRVGTTTLEGGEPRAVAASGAWRSSDTYHADIYFNETPFRLSVICTFTGDRLTYQAHQNVAFGPTERAHIVGQCG